MHPVITSPIIRHRIQSEDPPPQIKHYTDAASLKAESAARRSRNKVARLVPSDVRVATCHRLTPHPQTPLSTPFSKPRKSRPRHFLCCSPGKCDAGVRHMLCSYLCVAVIRTNCVSLRFRDGNMQHSSVRIPKKNIYYSTIIIRNLVVVSLSFPDSCGRVVRVSWMIYGCKTRKWAGAE